MKIVGIDIELLDLEMSTVLSGHLLLEQSCVVVRVRTDDGLAGVGVGTAGLAGGAVAAAAEALAPVIIGEDPLWRERIWQRLMEVSIVVLPPQAIAAIDCALWDLAGRAAGLSVQMLLGACRDRVPAYASTLTYDTTDEYLAVIDECLARGLKAVKLHGWGDATRDIELCRSVRDHVGPHVALMLDALGAYDIPTALRVGRVLETLDFEWFEMPIRDQSIHGYRELARALDIAVTSGECHTYGFQEASNYLSRSAWDIVRIDAAISGGVTGARKLAAFAEGFGVRCELHSYGHVLAQAANLQVIGSINNCKYFELPLPWDSYGQAALGAIHLDDRGNALIPQGPGLGIDLDWEVIAG